MKAIVAKARYSVVIHLQQAVVHQVRVELGPSKCLLQTIEVLFMDIIRTYRKDDLIIYPHVNWILSGWCLHRVSLLAAHTVFWYLRLK